MIIQDLHSSLQYGMLQSGLPLMILLHLGGNNRDNTNTWKIVCKAKSNIKYIFRNFPGSLLVWTDILPRLYWRNTDNTIQSLKAMDLKRKKVNRMIKSIVLKSKKISNDQELIQSDPISCPQNQKGNN